MAARPRGCLRGGRPRRPSSPSIYVLGARARLFEARYTIHADFTEVGGLREGATVRLAGVQIGRVTDVHLAPEPGGKVRVDLTIGRQFADRIRQDSVARIETQGLLGDRIVEITVGTAAAPAVKAGEVLDRARSHRHRAAWWARAPQTMKSVAALAESLRTTAETVNQSKVIQEAAAAVGSAARRMADRAGRILDRVETGPGLAHALLYDEPRGPPPGQRADRQGRRRDRPRRARRGGRRGAHQRRRVARPRGASWPPWIASRQIVERPEDAAGLTARAPVRSEVPVRAR